MEYPDAVLDRQAVYFGEFDRRMRQRLRALVSDAVIEEHRLKPLGQHSDALDRLLNYFRRGGMAGKLGIFQAVPGVETYQIVRFAGARGQPAVVENEAFGSLSEAYHAVFLRRIADLLSVD